MTRNSEVSSRSMSSPSAVRWAMKSSVTRCSASSVTSSWCFPISCSSRSNGPVKLSRRTVNRGGASVDRARQRPSCEQRHRARTSRASSRYAAAPADAGAQVVIGSPATVVSGNRTVRLITAWNTRSPNASTNPVLHLAGVQGARVEHRGEDAQDVQVRVEPVAHLVDGVHQQRHAAQAEELAGQRDEHGVGAGQRVDREQAERGLAVDQHDVVAVEHRLERPAQRLLAADLEDQLHLGGRQVDVAGQQVHALDRRLSDHLVDLGVALHEQVVDGACRAGGAARRGRPTAHPAGRSRRAAPCARTRRAPRRG